LEARKTDRACDGAQNHARATEMKPDELKRVGELITRETKPTFGAPAPASGTFRPHSNVSRRQEERTRKVHPCHPKDFWIYISWHVTV
jgi:hypothetical protein